MEVGTGVTTNVKVGDCITVGPILDKDGLKGKYNLGKNLSFVGLAADSGFTSYCVVDGELCHKLSDSIDYEQGTSEPAAAALYAVRQSSFKALHAAGATIIYAIELSPERQAKARKLGAVVVNPSKVNVVEHIKVENDDDVNVSFEITGVAPVLKQAIEAVENDGKCVIVSIWENEASIHPNEIVIKEKTVKGIIAYRDIFHAVLQLMEQGYFPKNKLVTKRIKLQDIVSEGFEALVKEKSQVKILVSPNQALSPLTPNSCPQGNLGAVLCERLPEKWISGSLRCGGVQALNIPCGISNSPYAHMDPNNRK
ncbi:zinc-binding dehydrogenase [Eikenella exigua]|uniref:zinc-binding dehydrogenase n=1 Tax=unclassified Eikenella TaxID=2639367 RepID=UPI000A8B4D5C